MKTTLAALTLTMLATFNAHAHADTKAPTPSVWSTEIKCSVMSALYFDFSKADPFSSVYGGIGSAPDIAITLEAKEFSLPKGTIQIPGTPFQVDIDHVMFNNTAGGKSLEYKSLNYRAAVRQDGRLIANAEGEDSKPATNFMLMAATHLTTNLAVEATLLQEAAYKTGNAKPLSDYIHQLDPQATISLNEITVTCRAINPNQKRK